MVRLLQAFSAFVALAYAITPEQMLGAPRRGTASVNPSGDWAVFTKTTFSWETNKATTIWQLLNVKSGKITDLPAAWGSEVNEIAWVGKTKTSVLYINGTNDEVEGGVTLYTADLAASPITTTKVASLGAAFSGLKAVLTPSGNINFVANALTYKNGSVYNEELATTSKSTARLYDNIYVRHFDVYISNQRYAVFGGSLAKKGNSYSLAGAPKNLLLGIDAPKTRPESPVQTFGDLGDYDLSPHGDKVVFLTKAPELPKANYTASYIYLVPHDGSSVAKAINGPGSKAPAEAKGASGAPRFSKDGKKVAYFQQDGISYESDRSKLYVADVSRWPAKIDPVAEDWDYSVGAIQWGPDDKTLYIGAEYIGVNRLFIIPVDARASFKPKELTGNYSVTDFGVLPDGKALVSSTALWTSREFSVVDEKAHSKSLFSAHKVDPELAGLGPHDYDAFFYTGSRGDQQQAIIVKPTGFDPSKKYPLVFYVHGGPQGVTGNVWSTRWNLKTWADQGYVIVGPNPTGSTSFGQQLTDAIQNNWGSYPYEDLVNAWEYIRDNLEYADVENAVEAGASYGGYMTNWIQGHDLGRKFKALVCHDGKISTAGSYSTEELWFIEHDFNGTVWNNPDNYARWDPINHAKNFSTPQFIIHSDLDYRVIVGEGLTLFNVLQSLGVPSRFLNFPNENHWVTNRQNSLVWHTQVFNWINYWTGKVDALDDSIVITA